MIRRRRKASEIPCRIDNIVHRSDGYCQVAYWQLDKNGNEQGRYSILVSNYDAQYVQIGSTVTAAQLKSINALAKPCIQ